MKKSIVLSLSIVAVLNGKVSLADPIILPSDDSSAITLDAEARGGAYTRGDNSNGVSISASARLNILDSRPTPYEYGKQDEFSILDTAVSARADYNLSKQSIDRKELSIKTYPFGGQEYIGCSKDDCNLKDPAKHGARLYFHALPVGFGYRENRPLNKKEIGAEWGLGSMTFKTSSAYPLQLKGDIEPFMLFFTFGHTKIGERNGDEVVGKSRGVLRARYRLDKKGTDIEAKLAADLTAISFDGPNVWAIETSSSVGIKNVRGSGIGVEVNYAKEHSDDGQNKQDVSQTMFNLMYQPKGRIAR